MVITDPVAYRFEKDGFYRERKKDLSSQISGAAERAGHDTGAERDTEKGR